MKIIEGSLVLREKSRIAIVCGRFNGFIVDHLESGCIDTLKRHGVAEEDLTIVRCPGAFEIPLVARRLAATGTYDAVITLGAVIRGSTPHFDHVAGACSRGVAAAAADTGVPVVFGVLTTDSIEQAVERAGTKAGNKGADAALTAIEMIALLRQI
ncbi:MAG: 6,7-dimethyl-8-ribityllumazine synthase [Gammaproteobacteria bacterium]|nr:6,7-dimethyl-8-ribityllumazine synthase [Gammaproteobacteria bacterium]MBI5618665.1 6,7-dimethyl-8-ribityllumazine synthase [Gammaproteobacteria bacterium]